MFTQAISKPKPKGPEHNSWFWNPNRIGAYQAPKWYMDKLKEVDLDNQIDIRWNPIRERWQVWCRSVNFAHPICSGWKLLFVVEENGEFVPLDERVLAKLFERSGRKWGNLWEYWLKVEQAMDRAALKAENDRADTTRYLAGEYFDYTQIKNIGSGSKFANNHS